MTDRKHDAGKPQLGSYIETHGLAFDLVGLVRNYGVSKYALASGWRRVPNIAARTVDSIYRHCQNPFSLDDESQLPHMAHAAMQMLIYSECQRDTDHLHVDPMEELYNPKEYAARVNPPLGNKEKWLQAWQEEKAAILECKRPILISETLVDFRQTLNDMAQGYQCLQEQKFDLDNLNVMTNLSLQFFKNRNITQDFYSIAPDIAANIFAMRAIELKYQGQRTENFIAPL